MASYLQAIAEESPRYEGAPTTTPYRLSTIETYFPVISGKLAFEPQFMSRADELRGQLSPTPDIVTNFLPAGSIVVRPYGNAIVYILHTCGLTMTATAGAGTNELQTGTVTGSPTGGTTLITWVEFGATIKTTLAYNETAATAQIKIDGTDGITPGDIKVGGGPWPGTALTFTYEGSYAAKNVAQATNVDSFTPSGTLTITTTTPGAVGAVTLPDGRGVPTGATRWVSTKQTGSSPKTLQLQTVYDQTNDEFIRGQGYACSALAMGADGQLNATMTGLVAKAVVDPGETPAYDALAVHPFIDRDLVVTWAGDAGNVSAFSWSLANPIEATRNFGVRSAYPGKMRFATQGVTALSGTVEFDEADTDDRVRFLSGDVFDATANWRSRSKVASSGAPYEMFAELQECQYVGGQGIGDIQEARRFPATYEWRANYDSVATYDFKLTLVNGVAAIENYV